MRGDFNTMNNSGDFDIKNAISGVLVVDKPVGLTSHDVVQIVRKAAISGAPVIQAP
jgi:tRNA U55 pseudouridine synthase TruB